MKDYRRVSAFLAEHPWAMLRERLDAMIEVVEMHVEGRPLPEFKARGRSEARQQIGAVAVIPVQGIIAHRMNMMTEMSGGTSTDLLGAAITSAAHDPNVSAIVMDVDSPGGSVFGIQELADQIFRARGSKLIVASVNATAASAAYWIASQADEIVVTPSGQVGSIGVVAVHQDRSEMAAKLGVKHTFVTSAKFKAAGNELEPLDDATRADMQKRVDQYGDVFRRAVARGRGVTAANVRDRFGEGRMFGAAEAVKLGMVDGIGTLGDVVTRLASGQRSAIAASRDLRELEPMLDDHHIAATDQARVEAEEFRQKLAALGA